MNGLESTLNSEMMTIKNQLSNQASAAPLSPYGACPMSPYNSQYDLMFDADMDLSLLPLPEGTMTIIEPKGNI
jgi:hypothetical protein